jgi:hypothetical protein
MATQITRLVETSQSNSVKTTAYLTLEVLYASRRLTTQGDHIDSVLKTLFDNMEMPDVDDLGEADGADEDAQMQAQGFATSQSEQRVVAYIQATT